MRLGGPAIEGLRARLAELGVRPDAVDLSGEERDEAYTISTDGERYSVHYAERGERGDERWHASLSAACADLLERVEQDPSTRV